MYQHGKKSDKIGHYTDEMGQQMSYTSSQQTQHTFNQCQQTRHTRHPYHQVLGPYHQALDQGSLTYRIEEYPRSLKIASSRI